MAASTNLTSIAYVLEATIGQTPSTPTFQLLPTTGGSPVNNITTTVSDVIRSDRQTDDLIITDGEVSGELNYELSYAPYKDFMNSVLMDNTVSRSATMSTVGITASTSNEIDKASINTNVEIGDVVKLTSLSDPTINGGYVIVSFPTSGTAVVYPDTGALGDLTDVELSMSDTLQNGVKPLEGNTYTIRKTADNNGTDYYWYYRGCSVNTMSFNFATGSILNGSIGIVGLTELAQTSKLAGETADTAIPAYSIMNSVTSVGALRIEGVTLGACNFSSMDLTIDNQIAGAKGIGVLGSCDLAPYSVMVTGNVEVYFANLDLYNKFLAADSFGVTVIVEDGDGNVIGIDMPKCKFETLDTPISGKDAFLMQSGSFKALRHDTLDYMVKISRTDA